MGCLNSMHTSAFQQGLISAFRQPARAFKVAFEGLKGTVGFLLGVYSQNITGHLMVIFAFARSIQEGEIGCEMRPVISCNAPRHRRFNSYFRSGRGRDHSEIFFLEIDEFKLRPSRLVDEGESILHTIVDKLNPSNALTIAYGYAQIGWKEC